MLPAPAVALPVLVVTFLCTQSVTYPCLQGGAASTHGAAVCHYIHDGEQEQQAASRLGGAPQGTAAWHALRAGSRTCSLTIPFSHGSGFTRVCEVCKPQGGCVAP